MLKRMHSSLALLSMAAVFCLAGAPAAALLASDAPQGDSDAPTAVDMTIDTYQEISCTGVFSTQNAGEGVIRYTLCAEPRKGSVKIGEDGETFVYTPDRGKKGEDSFTFTASDRAGRTSAPATVTVRIAKKKTAVSYGDMLGRKAYPAAICLAEKGIYVGRQVGKTWLFSPDEEVSRSEFLAMAMEAADIAAPSDVRLTGFADDSAIPTWVKGYASAAVREGVVNGIGTAAGVNFCGEDSITAAEAAAILDRLLDVADVPVEQSGGWAESWAAQEVANMVSVAVVGDFETPDDVDQHLSRAQAAEMLAAAIALLENQEEGGLFSWLK